MRAKIAVFFIFCSLVGTPFVVAEGTVGDYMYGIGTKFGRGLENADGSVFDHLPVALFEHAQSLFVPLAFGDVAEGALHAYNRA